MWINLLYVSALIIAIGFFIFVIYLSKTLTSVQKTLKQMTGTVSELEKQLRGVTKETTELLSRTNQLAEDLQKKSESLNTIVNAVKEIGDSVQRVNGAFKNISKSVTEKADMNSEKVTQVIQWGNVAIDLWDKWKQKKNAKITYNNEGN